MSFQDIERENVQNFRDEANISVRLIVWFMAHSRSNKIHDETQRASLFKLNNGLIAHVDFLSGLFFFYLLPVTINPFIVSLKELDQLLTKNPVKGASLSMPLKNFMLTPEETAQN